MQIIPPRILIPISALIYVIYIVVFAGLFIKKNTTLRRLTARMMFIVMAGIAINSLVTGSMIFPQPRYMCYGMGLFYFAIVCSVLA